MSGAVQACLADPCPQLKSDKAKVEALQVDAQLADAVYEPDPSKRQLPPAYREIRDKQSLMEMGLLPRQLEPQDSDFRAAVFQSDDGRTVVAFKGTTPTSLEDWKNNAQQEMFAKSSYYTEAQKISFAMKQSGTTPEFTGHSLGGGLASAAARRSGANASTFNAAGLNPNTLVGRESGGTIDRVYVKGDIVTGVQIGPASRAASDKDWALDPPKGIGNAIVRGLITGVGAVVGGPLGALATRGITLHSMGSVHKSLADKQQAISQEIALKCGP